MPKTYHTLKRLCERYDRSKMTISRWRNDPRLGFPRPIYIQGHPYFDDELLDEFDRRRATEPPPSSPNLPLAQAAAAEKRKRKPKSETVSPQTNVEA